ncbi:MAG: chemotaxis protein CheB [Rhizomicrobium sp.]
MEDGRVDGPEATPAGARVPVVGIGASAGGVGALRTLFEALPGELGASFVVIVHLDPGARSELPAILAAHSAYPVEQVTGASKLEPNHVYVIAPDRQLRISDHEIAAVPFDEPRGRRCPIDIFFRSLADQEGDSCAVILTGAGSDGAVGVKAIKEAGGIVLVQDPEEAEYPSMPRSAIATDIADFVLPLRDLSQRIVELVRSARERAFDRGPGDAEETLRRILAYLRSRTGHDFNHYKRTTVHRRILRRMQVARADTFQGYFDYLRANPQESVALLSDLLISVTTFFRDPDAFDALAKHVIPKLFGDPDAGPIRIWVAGCATGEEAYSIAILLMEEAARRDIRPDIQIFASDLDSAALAIAREGRYPAAIAADMNEERLHRFFTDDGEFYRVKRELRDKVLFASHSILKDPPFSRLDLVSCRNLLIYLEREMQQQVLTTLHYGLNPGGYLFLGSSETADLPAGYFRTVNRDARIFQSTGRSQDQLPALPRLLPSTPALAPLPGADHRERPPQPAQMLHRQALETAAPPSVVVDGDWHVIHLSENAGRYLQPAGGALSVDIVDLARPELRLELRAALHRALETGKSVLSAPLFVQFNGTAHRTYVHVKPVPQGGRERNAQRALIFFIESEADEPFAPGATRETAAGEDVRRLQQELELMQSALRNTREDSESANEELRAANEELQSINEEYRSTAEELETSKEELQSINEELQTVNSELKLKLETVSRAHSDVLNLMAASDVGTLFLDPELRIKRLTPPLTDIFNVTQGDIERPITDFTHRLEYEEFADDARRVLRNLAPVEREVRSKDGLWFLVRFRPYRTVENRIDGVVATFLDITQRRETEDALRRSAEQLEQKIRLVELSRAPIFVWDLDDGIVQWNRGSEELYGYTNAEAIGRRKDELLRTEVPGSSFGALRQELLEKGIWKGELRHIAKNGRALRVESQIELGTIEGRRCVLESTRDITYNKMLEARQHLLVDELTHRVKNLLTVVQGIVHQTRRSSASAEEFERKLDGRINALGNALKLLVDSSWQGAGLRELIEHQVAPHVGDDPGRLELAGEPVALPPGIATPFGLVFHELATNAAKYGALSDAKGRIELHWRKVPGNIGDAIEVSWTERGGPKVTSPARPGFGSRLITRGIPGARVSHEFLRDGVRCTIAVPLDIDERADK